VTTTRDSPDGLDVVRLVVRVWLPDRPGALGLVASRIGAIGADIVGVDVLERSEHVAVDEFAVTLESEDLVKLLVREIEEVDGASVEQWERVERFPDPLDALETIDYVCAATDVADLAARLTARVHEEFNADWSAVLHESALVAAHGDDLPDPSVLHAFASGTSASPAVAAGDSGPDDLAVAPLVRHGSFLLVGRAGHPFRRRERRQLLALARVADRISLMLSRRPIGLTTPSAALEIGRLLQTAGDRVELGVELAVVLQARRVDLAARDGRLHRAARLAVVRTIVKATLRRELLDVGERAP
jgi:hypothetical protein